MTVDISQVEQAVIPNIWLSDGIYRNLLHLCDDLGHRFGGSDSEHQAAEYLRQKMVEYGLTNVHLEEFPMYTWERGDCEIMLTGPVERHLSTMAMPYCPSVDMEGDVVDVGEGEAADFERVGDAIRGKIVLTDAESGRPGGESKSHRTDKYRQAVDGGAIACVFLNLNPGLLHITGALYAKNPGGPNVEDHEAPIPGVGISWESGSLVRRMAERGPLKMRIKTNNKTVKSHSNNVVGDIRGGELANEIVLFGGHYDGHDVAQGAGDDAAGTLVGLEVGRVLAPFAGQFKRTIRIICFGCEEIGLLGSFHHADEYAKHPDEKLVWVMNLDSAGNGPGGYEHVNTTADPGLVPYFEQWAKDHHYAFEARSGLSAHSDHFPFFLKGYPSGSLASRNPNRGMIGRGFGHTEADTVDKVNLRGLQMCAIFAARVAATLANDTEFAPPSRSQDEVRALLEEKNQADLLEHHWGRDNRADV
ncbi:MAG TPA: M28 family peptidase [Thermomicrobiaceae bacterium]|nr:M28 family peptidase [Thermomicrobiaceae bacterium]